MSKNILLVDDDDVHLLWATEILEQEGYVTESAKSVSSAMDFLKNNKYDLIITDLVMPGMSGIDFIKEVAEKYKGQKAIVMTGHADVDSFIESVYDIGAMEYIIKPVPRNDFVAMVNKLTGEVPKTNELST